MNLKERVKELIDKGLEQNTSLFLIDFSIVKDNLIKVIIDGDNGVSIEDCVALSRAIEHNLDREEEDFSLEVSSCGILAPLTLERQYVKNKGREIEIQTLNEKHIGTIEKVEEFIRNIISKIGASGIKDMGKVMGEATKELAGKADGKLIASIVKKVLS